MGVLTAISAGEATVTVSTTDGQTSDSILVTVNEPPVVENLRFDPAEVSLKVGDEYTLTAKYESDRDIPLLYHSSNEMVLAVDDDGNMLALTEGEADIYTGYGNQMAVCKVTVSNKEACEDGNHTYDNGVVTKQPTCREEGIMTYTCTVCDTGTEGHTKTELISKNPANHAS